MKIKEWIRTKIIQFLLIDDMQEHNLSELSRIEKGLKESNKYFYNFEKCTKENFKDSYDELHTLQHTIESVVSIGADIAPMYSAYSRSWAVVCIEGKVNVVKFVDLSREDCRYVMDFLKQFDGSRRVIDSFPSRELFERDFKF